VSTDVVARIQAELATGVTLDDYCPLELGNDA
jgi:hypothetical protein